MKLRAGRFGQGSKRTKQVAQDPGQSRSLQSKNDIFELEILDGLVPICKQELASLIGSDGKIYDADYADQLAFEFSGKPSKLFKLRTAVAVFQLLYFKVPHPLTVTQGPNLERLLTAINLIRKGARFTSFRIGAAGSDSTVFRKIKSVLNDKTGLINDEKEGEMSIRFRRSRLKPFGWDVLIRLTPLPLSARSWRIENMPGALNATIAAAMVLATGPRPGDQFLNLMCGSGTILAERAAICPAKKTIGVDISGAAIKKSRKNLSFLTDAPLLLEEDISKLSIQDASADVICTDLPWGRLIGRRDELHGLYMETMRQATRVCITGGKFAVITQEIETFEDVLDVFKPYWEILDRFRVKQSDYKPKFYLLRRSNKALGPTKP